MSFEKESVLHLNRISIYIYNEKYIESQDMKPYKTFLVPFDSTKLNLLMRNNSVKIEKKT